MMYFQQILAFLSLVKISYHVGVWKYNIDVSSSRKNHSSKEQKSQLSQIPIVRKPLNIYSWQVATRMNIERALIEDVLQFLAQEKNLSVTHQIHQYQWF